MKKAFKSKYQKFYTKKEDMMDWIKCTDRMPPDMEPVMVTVRVNDGGKQTWVDVRYNPEYKEWEQLADAVGDYWEGLGKDYEVTHWMPYPEPAED